MFLQSCSTYCAPALVFIHSEIHVGQSFIYPLGGCSHYINTAHLAGKRTGQCLRCSASSSLSKDKLNILSSHWPVGFMKRPICFSVRYVARWRTPTPSHLYLPLFQARFHSAPLDILYMKTYNKENGYHPVH